MEGYLPIKEIGKGSFGIVHLAQRVCDGKIVAMKKILKFHRNENDLKSLGQEWDIQRKLNHPNIIRILDAFETPDCMVIITEYAQNGELTRLINSTNGKGLDITTVRSITCDLVSALNYLFNQRILHRDLKPQNILIGSDGHCKLCDFGFAKTIGINDFLLTSIKGTPLYMAPEIFQYGSYDQKAELWSLGCIIYELLFGKPPFLTSSLYELTRMIYAENIIFPPEIFFGDCRSFVKGLLEKLPERRITWDQILDHPFIRDHARIDNTRGEFSLAKALSPSQELLREKQKQTIQKKMHEYSRLMLKTQKKMQKAQKQLENCVPESKIVPTPIHSPNTGQTSKGQQQQQATIAERPKLSPTSATTTGGRVVNYHNTSTAEVTNLIRKVQIVDNAEDNNSDSSCETLTSSSEDDDVDSDEDMRTIVNGSGNSTEANEKTDNTTQITVQNPVARKPGDLFWKSGALFTLHSLGLDKPIQSEEWIHFLGTTMKAIMANPRCICEKHFLTVLVAPLRNHLTSPDVIERIADVLGVPFTMDDDLPQDLVFPLQSMYLDSKVVPNLLYAVKVIVRRRGIESKSTDLDEIVSFLNEEDFSALNKCLRLVCFLVYLDEGYVVQFCDSLCVLQLFPTLLLLLKLDSNNVSFTGDMLAILCQLMRTIPSNYCIVEELFFGDCPIARNVEELWRLLQHADTRIKSRAIRLLAYLSVNSSKTGDQFIKHNALKLWKCIQSALQSEVSELREAAKFASKNIDILSSDKESHSQKSMTCTKVEIVRPPQNIESQSPSTATNPSNISSDESR
ncbi:Serine/threonine-protein kinase 36 [Folsomia candida]|uniref:non-specific serine/threonine protein kinase n=1 Tax=Folsomia candida TaxID=158441 RepID=A0A226EKC2_FOLCA|nr:Serine/threonine-protein kinase 36 [Folsomia candida]